MLSDDLDRAVSPTLPIKTLAAALAHRLDRSLPGRLRGRLSRQLKLGTNRYLAPGVGEEAELFHALDRRGARYAVISGSPATTVFDPKAPMALIIADEDVNATRKLVSPWPAGKPVEVYSPSGLPGFAFGDMPLLPPRLARRILDGARRSNGARVASPHDQFFVNLFRQVYLKGWSSGIPSETALSTRQPAIAHIIANQADELGIAIANPITLESLDALLIDHDWQPPLDMLERIGCWNGWVAEKLKKAGEWIGSEPAGLTVFYLRQRTIDEGKAETVFAVLRQSGFELHFPATPLTDQQLRNIAAEVRGGNWGKGPFPLSGGEPALVFAGFDPAPIPPDAAALAQFPLLDNNRIQFAKQAVRDAVHAGLPRHARYNAMHSTDNAVQAWRALRSHFPALEPILRERSRPPV